LAGKEVKGDKGSCVRKISGTKKRPAQQKKKIKKTGTQGDKLSKEEEWPEYPWKLGLKMPGQTINKVVPSLEREKENVGGGRTEGRGRDGAAWGRPRKTSPNIVLV